MTFPNPVNRFHFCEMLFLRSVYMFQTCTSHGYVVTTATVETRDRVYFGWSGSRRAAGAAATNPDVKLQQASALVVSAGLWWCPLPKSSLLTFCWCRLGLMPPKETRLLWEGTRSPPNVSTALHTADCTVCPFRARCSVLLSLPART